MHRRGVAALLALAAVVLLAAGGLVAWRSLQEPPYEQSLAVLPAETLRAAYTDWQRVRAQAGGTALGSGSSQQAVERFLSRAYEQDLTSTSALAPATYALNRHYGFSPVDATWESYGQSREGAVVVTKLPETVTLAGVEDNLRSLGYEPPPGGAGSGGVWSIPVDALARLQAGLSEVMLNVVVLHEERVVLMSDESAYAASAADVAQEEAPSLLETTEGVASLATVPDEPGSALLFASDFACEALSMGQASEEDQAVAESLVQQAGEVSPLSGLLFAREPDGAVTVGMHFEDEQQAEENLQPRIDLASGEAVTRSGTFTERFEVVDAGVSGSDVVLTLQPAGPDAALMSDFAQGPLLFAAC